MYYYNIQHFYIQSQALFCSKLLFLYSKIFNLEMLTT